jgi:hypothetical protein
VIVIASNVACGRYASATGAYSVVAFSYSLAISERDAIRSTAAAVSASCPDHTPVSKLARGESSPPSPASQQIELGTLTWIKDGSSLNFHLEELLDWPLAEGVAYRARMLIRHSFAELYLDDRLVKSFACREELAPAVHGFYSRG